jgi:uncharacterized protein
MKNYFSKIFFALLLLSSAMFVKAQDIPRPSNPPKLVNDFTNTLTPDQQLALEHKLEAFHDSTSTQVAVVIVGTTGDYDIAEYAVKLGREWGIGDKEFNNGVILLIAINDRKVHIATGYGVEGALPDITANHIIDDVIRPNFKGNDYYRGIDEGTDAIIQAVKGEYKAPPAKKGKAGIPFIVIAVILFLLFAGGGKGKGGQFMSRRGSRGLAGPLIWGSLLGGGGGGGWSGGGGGSSGGFGGFGGGSFGGGGASGSW